MYERRRNIVVRRDGRRVNVARFRGQLLVCATGCCCGRTEDGFAAVPAETFHREWERRRLRNVVLLLFDGQAQWFHSIDSDALAIAVYDHVEAMLAADAGLPPSAALAPYLFTASAWQPRPDGQPVDDVRLWPPRAAHQCAAAPSGVTAAGEALSVDRVVAIMDGRAALPRKNGELVFEEPWQGRVFGMAVALHERGLYEWEEFRQGLIAHIALAERRPGPFSYYEIWLQTFETLLAGKGLVTPAELEETTYQFEFGERDDVF